MEWVYNVDEGIKLGEKVDKDVIIYFVMKKCVPCRFIKKYAFITEEFKEYSKKFVSVWVKMQARLPAVVRQALKHLNLDYRVKKTADRNINLDAAVLKIPKPNCQF